MNAKQWYQRSYILFGKMEKTLSELMRLSHLFVTVFLSAFTGLIVTPALTDVTMSALCPGRDECSLAIYLTGFQQGIIGLGTVVMMPLIGSLSDQYGRKALLALPLTFSIVPLLILAYSRTTNFFYAYYILRTLTAMLSEGSVYCLALAYLADITSQDKRASAYGILTGASSAAYVAATLTARFVSTANIFQVSAAVSVFAAVYMQVFLEESLPKLDNELARPILKKVSDNGIGNADYNLAETRQVFKKIPSLQDMISLLKTSKTFAQIAVVSFFNSLADCAVQSTMLYYLKARFHFSKNQFADLMLMSGLIMTVSQLFLTPLLVPAIGEKRLLSIGLLMSCTNSLLLSIAWANWIPYAASGLYVLMIFVHPCLRSIASKQVSPNEQGKAQGCISGITSLANIISPLIFSPLTALFLSEEAPFHFPGFSLVCIGLATMIAFIQSIMITPASPMSSHRTKDCDEP